MTPRLLMPDPQEAKASGLMADYSAYRRWWSRKVLKLKLRKIDEPDPAVLDGADPENG